MENKNSVNSGLPDIRRSYNDPDTGEKVQVTHEMVVSLAQHEHLIASSTLTMALSLKAIRDQKLYLLRGFTTMKDYVGGHIAKSYSSAKYYLQIADAIEDVTNKKQFESLSLTAIGDISRDLTLVEKLKKGEAEIEGDKIVYADGSEESVDDFRAHIKAEAKREVSADIQKAASATAKVRNESKALKSLVESKSQEVLERDEEIARLRRTIDEVSQLKDIDPRRLRALTSKKEAMELMRSISEQVLEALAGLNTIERDVFDAELAGHLKTCVASLETGLHRTKTDFNDILFVTEHAE